MYVFLIVVLLLAVLLEYLSIRTGSASANYNFSLSEMRTEPGQEISMICVMKNLSRLPVTYLSVRTSFPLETTLPEGLLINDEHELSYVTDIFRMWGKQKITRSLPFSLEKRGVHTICAKEICRGDFLGLSSDTNILSIIRKVVIFPKRLESTSLVEALGNYCGELAAQRWLIRDPILTLGIREYTGNEPMHTISWTHTAQRNEIMVREFDYTRSLNCCIILCTDSLDRSDFKLLDIACSAARTICEELIEKGIEAEFYTNADLIGYERNPFRKHFAAAGQIEDLLDTLARATPNSLCSLLDLIDYSSAQQSNESAYVIIAPRETKDTFEALSQIQARTGNSALLITAESLLTEISQQ